MRSPKIPDPIRAPYQTQPQPLQSNAPPTSGVFRPTPSMLGFNMMRPGRRSLVGGN